MAHAWAVVVVKWSAFLPSTPTIRVRIPLKSTVFSVILCLKRTKINKKRPGLAHFFKKVFGKCDKIISLYSLWWCFAIENSLVEASFKKLSS